MNISLPWQVYAQEDRAIISWRECSKKHALSLSEGSVQQDRSHFDVRSVHGVREHGKMARTPLAAFFNIPIRGVCAILTPCRTSVSAPKQGKLFLRELYLLCFSPFWDGIQVFGIHYPNCRYVYWKQNMDSGACSHLTFNFYITTVFFHRVSDALHAIPIA